MTFVNSSYFFLLLLLLPYIFWYVRKHREVDPTLRISSTDAFRGLKKSWKEKLIHAPFVLRILCFIFAVFALARPQSTTEFAPSTQKGIDIMLCMDVSGSMLFEDLSPNRIEASKEVAKNFIKGRPNDNIGLTLFAGQAFTQCPLTSDHNVLLNILDQTRCDIVTRGIIDDGTAIGMGLANSVSRLKDSKAKSKVVILLTDGTNNAGELSPNSAAEIAKTFGIRVYTIGVGTEGNQMVPIMDRGQHTMAPNVEVKMDALDNIAKLTGGKSFRATDNATLQKVYDEIDKLEKTKLQVINYSHMLDLFPRFLMLSILMLVLELALRFTVLKRIP